MSEKSPAILVVDEECSDGVMSAADSSADPPKGSSAENVDNVDNVDNTIPLRIQLVSVLVVSMIGFGGHWSGGVTGALKSTLKRELGISNTQYAVLDASEDFIKTALILPSGLLTDRYGGAGTMLWGNALFSVGSVLVAAATAPAVRSYRFMIGGVVVRALGDVATQVAQYKIFSSWFAPSAGFASTLAFELGLGKIGSFVGKATANVIAANLGDFSWAYWMAVFMNLFTNAATLFFWWFTRWCERRYAGVRDPATGERLTERNRRFELRKALRLPWPFWIVVLFSLFQTSTARVFSSSATEFAQQRFHVSPVKAGWYAAMSQYLGFFFVPLVGVFIDLLGRRLWVMLACGSGMLLAMSLAAWGPTVPATAASFAVYAIASSMGPTLIIDAIRTSMTYQDVFGFAYAVKIAINNSMAIIVSVVAGAIQDRDPDDSYDHVAVLYAVLAAGSVVVALVALALAHFHPILAALQYSRRQRIAHGHLINAAKDILENGPRAALHRRFSLVNLSAVIALVLASWGIYFWGVATGNS